MSRPRRKVLAAPIACVIYLRVSTEEQERSGLGREAQEATCRKYASRQGWEIAAIHVEDGLSGKLPVAERPALAAAIAAANAGPGVAFLVYSLTRAFRTQRECWMTIEDDHGEPALPLVSATEPFDLTTAFGRASFGMLATFARLEADLCADRTVAALDAARARGVVLGAPKMHERVVDGVRETDPAKMAVVVRIQAMRREGLSYAGIAAKLNAEGVASSKGGRWHVRTVRVALGTDTAAE
jgi:DNA invertase Pin-like site-specific DNA recombinase